MSNYQIMVNDIEYYIWILFNDFRIT